MSLETDLSSNYPTKVWGFRIKRLVYIETDCVEMSGHYPIIELQRLLFNYLK